MKNLLLIVSGLAILCAALFIGCTTTTTTAPDGTQTKVVRLDVQSAAEATALAEQILSNPVVSNAVYTALNK